jgi:hypothetical protein
VQKRINERSISQVRPGRNKKPVEPHSQPVTSQRDRTTNKLLSFEKTQRKELRQIKEAHQRQIQTHRNTQRVSSEVPVVAEEQGYADFESKDDFADQQDIFMYASTKRGGKYAPL